MTIDVKGWDLGLPPGAIATPYCPDECHAELGWLWLEGEGDFPGEYGWAPVVTWLPDGKDAEPQIRILRRDHEDEAYPADDLAGTPYLPAAAPKGRPEAGLEVTLRIHGGATATVTLASPGEDTDRVARDCIALLTDNEGNGLIYALDALRAALRHLYESLQSDLEAFCLMEDGTPRLDTLGADDCAFLRKLVSTLQFAEGAIGRELPADAAPWLGAAIDEWHFGEVH